MPFIRPDIDAAIDQFILLLQALYNDHFAKTLQGLTPPTIERDGGTKYLRIATVEYRNVNGQSVPDEYGRSVYCFIDLNTGDILKAEGWKKPAKGARGSIFNENCDVGYDKPANIHGAGLYARR